MIQKVISSFFIGLFILAGSITAKAGGTGPAMDSIPANKQKPAETDAKKADEIIKEVPKSRKQEKPLAVTTVIIKPVIVKPKIVVKPVIKVRL